MISDPKKTHGMDVIIVCTGSVRQEEFWQQRLLALRGVIAKSDAIVIAVHEDWKGGAGNGLGTLYAYRKAQEKGKKLFGLDLFDLQKKGSAIAIYHAAGEGKRLFPLCASEYSNKPAVKLPSGISEKIPSDVITVLEAVILQSAVFAPFRKGRLSVFWGDQVFLPSKNCYYLSESHIDLFAKVGPKPNEEEWHRRGLENYGLAAIDEKGDVQLIDKCSFDKIQQLITAEKLQIGGGIGCSLGSFSLSGSMTFALMDEFKIELEQKAKQWDSDPFFWMAATLDFETFVDVMEKKGYGYNFVAQHFKRMQEFRDNFQSLHPKDRFMGAVDVGSDCCWWDYGTIDTYIKNILKLTRDNEEAEAMLKFFKLSAGRNSAKQHGLAVDAQSCLLNCNIGHGTVKNSILIGVNAEHVEVSNSIIINSTLKSVQGDECLLYNIVEQDSLNLEPKTIRADVFLPASQEHAKVYSRQGRDGRKDWKSILPGNNYSYEKLQELTQNVDLYKAQAFAAQVKNHVLGGLASV